MATRGHQSLNKYSLTLSKVQGLQEKKTVPFPTKLLFQRDSHTSTNTQMGLFQQ